MSVCGMCYHGENVYAHTHKHMQTHTTCTHYMQAQKYYMYTHTKTNTQTHYTYTQTFPFPSSHRLLLYFSLFGFTLEPRCNRERFEPPKTFLHHIDFTSPSRKSSSPHFCSSSSSNPPRKTDQDSSIHSSASSSSSSSSSSSVHSVSPLHHSGIHNKPHMSANSGSVGTHPNGPTLYHRHKDHSHSSDTLGKVNNVISNIRRLKPQISQNHVGLQKDKSGSNAVPSVTGIRWNEGVRRYSPEYSLLLRCTPDEVRNEVDLLLSDLVVRLKQLLFNSLLCAYYVGFIPMQFADVREVGGEGEGGGEGRGGEGEGEGAVTSKVNCIDCYFRVISIMTSGGVWNTLSWSGPTLLSSSPLISCLPATVKSSISAPCTLAVGRGWDMTKTQKCTCPEQTRALNVCMCVCWQSLNVCVCVHM